MKHAGRQHRVHLADDEPSRKCSSVPAPPDATMGTWTACGHPPFNSLSYPSSCRPHRCCSATISPAPSCPAAGPLDHVQSRRSAAAVDDRLPSGPHRSRRNNRWPVRSASSRTRRHTSCISSGAATAALPMETLVSARIQHQLHIVDGANAPAHDERHGDRLRRRAAPSPPWPPALRPWRRCQAA